MNTTTRISERSVEMSAEIKPFPSAVKYPERKTFRPMNRKTGQNSFRPSHVRSKTWPPLTNRWMICWPSSSETARISTDVMAMVMKL